jgi:hypothetical protein
VFFICGFDPQGPAHYHRLYAAEAARQAAVSGYRIEVGSRVNGGDEWSTWGVRWREASEDAARVETTFEFLRWDDIVREHWPRQRWRVMLGTLASTARQVRNGVLWRILKTSWPAFLVLAMPPLLVLGLAGWWGLTLAGAGAAWRWHGALPAGASLAMIVALVGASGWGCWRLAAWGEAKVQMAWLMRSTRFILAQARGRVPALERRLDEFGRRIAEAWNDATWDEVLVAGHSSGAMLAVSAVARALSSAGEAGAIGRRALSLLTLGECVPVLSYQPEAVPFRRELALLARSPAVDWVDFTAPPDGCCFALVDPTAVCTDRGTGEAWRAPKRLSPRFAQLFREETYARLRRDKYRCHFQYLMASELPGAYDYFAITAGGLRLLARFAAEPSIEGFREFQMFGGDR